MAREDLSCAAGGRPALGRASAVSVPVCACAPTSVRSVPSASSGATLTGAFGNLHKIYIYGVHVK